MTATNALSTAILKRRYASGRVPKANFEEFPFFATVQKKEDFVGDDYVLPIQTENPQGVGPSIQQAQGSAAQGTYVRFLLTRVEYFGVARIKGQALRTATLKGDGALVDLWKNETDGVTQTVLKQNEIFGFGTGNGVLATIASGIGTTAVTLTVVEDINNIDVGMRVKLVSDTTLSPTVRANEAVVTQVDRAAGTITIGSAWSTVFPGASNGDSIVRSGDQAIAGVPSVPAGMRQWLIGGNAPGTWKSLPRNGDPVRLASQSLDMTGLAMSDAIIDLESLITIQGKMSKKVLWANPRDLRQVKKSQMGKVTFPREKVASTIGNLSFEAIQWEGDAGTIPMMLSPFCPRNNVFLKDMSTFAFYSAGPAPQPLDYDKSDFLRVATDDVYEVRIGEYGDYGEASPVKSARGTNWGL